MKLNRDERRAIVSTIQRRLTAENKELREKLRAEYKPSKKYLEAERTLKELSSACTKFQKVFGYEYQYQPLTEAGIQDKLNQIKEKEIRQYEKVISDQELEDRIIIASLDPQFNIESFIEEIVKSIK